ncbi:AMP-binding protein [Agromyces sp. SYSU K20354]|uniref:AMP-binding enzyme n=1 Tax=Agromyces cavernae TaxID=2898659 RepID=UPI001E567B8D|nr:AMP-binding protein [Agromyces cavernae]MCD2442563.1 AMP-binding protein [Agromyces cavernae]
MLDWLDGDGDGDGEAIRLAGRRLSRAELRESVDVAAGALSSAAGPVLARDDDTLAVLVTTLAARVAGRQVIVADPSAPAPAVDGLPAGADLVLMTSGSSGTSRPVARTLASWTSSFEPFAELIGSDRLGRRSDLTVALTGPLHVSMQLFAALHAIWLGAVLTDDRAQADIVHATPTSLGRLVSRGLRPRRAVVAGAALPASVLAAASSAGIAVTEYYGAAELSFVAAADRTRDDESTLRPFPGVEVELRDGEVWSRSPYLALGYAGAVDGPLRRDERGFATVGDRAEAGRDGGLIVRGRGDAAVMVSGTTVLAEDVEAAIAAIPGVVAVAVVAVADAHHGQVPAAILELAAHADRDRITATARAVLAPPQRPRAWYAVDALPRTTAGKLARGALSAALASGSLDADRFDRA